MCEATQMNKFLFQFKNSLIDINNNFRLFAFFFHYIKYEFEIIFDLYWIVRIFI